MKLKSYLLTALLAAFSSAQLNQNLTTLTYGKNSNYILQINPMLHLSPPEIEFIACFPDKTWMGVGIGGAKMVKAELLFFMASPNDTLRQVISTSMSKDQTKGGRPKVFPESSPFYQSTINNSCGDGQVLFTARRPLDATHLANASHTKPLVVGTKTKMCIAGYENDFNQTYTTIGRGFSDTFLMLINPDGTVMVTAIPDHYALHGILLWVAWGFLGLIQFCSSRYMKPIWRVSMWIHRISGMLIWGITFGFVFLVYVDVDWRQQGGLHPSLGLATLCVVGVLSLCGFLVRWQLEKVRWQTGMVLKVKVSHMLFGYLCLILGTVTLLTGSLKYGDEGKEYWAPLGIAGTSTFYGIIILSEIWHQIYKRKIYSFQDGDLIITREEFDRRIAGSEQLTTL